MAEQIIVKHPVDLVAHLSSIRSRKQEHFGVAFLDSGLELISKKILFVGGISRCIIGIWFGLVFMTKVTRSRKQYAVYG